MSTRALVAPEKPLISPNGTAQNKVQPSSGGFDKLLIANTTLTVWLIFFAMGGGILALYYSKIHYLPEMEWKASLIYLFIGSMVGGGIGLLLTISLFIPGVLWSEFIIFDRFFEKHFSYDKERREPCIRAIISCLGIPFLLVLLISHVMLLVDRALYYWVLATVLLMVTFWLMRLRFRSILNSNGAKSRALKQRKAAGVGWFLGADLVRTASNAIRTLNGQPCPTGTKAGQTFKYSSWFTLSVLLSQISMFVIYRLADSPSAPLLFATLTVICTAGVWVSNHIVAARHRHAPRQAVVAAVVTAGLLLFTADKFSCLSMKLMGHYGLGDDQNVNVLVNSDGAEIIKELDVPQCGERRLCHVQILSKMGNDYYLKVDQISITLPRAYVRSIERVEYDLTKPVSISAVTAR